MMEKLNRQKEDREYDTIKLPLKSGKVISKVYLFVSVYTDGRGVG